LGGKSRKKKGKGGQGTEKKERVEKRRKMRRQGKKVVASQHSSGPHNKGAGKKNRGGQKTNRETTPMWGKELNEGKETNQSSKRWNERV